jgi:hypothetical protein
MLSYREWIKWEGSVTMRHSDRRSLREFGRTSPRSMRWNWAFSIPWRNHPSPRKTLGSASIVSLGRRLSEKISGQIGWARSSAKLGAELALPRRMKSSEGWSSITLQINCLDSKVTSQSLCIIDDVKIEVKFLIIAWAMHDVVFRKTWERSERGWILGFGGKGDKRPKMRWGRKAWMQRATHYNTVGILV